MELSWSVNIVHSQANQEVAVFQRDNGLLDNLILLNATKSQSSFFQHIFAIYSVNSIGGTRDGIFNRIV